MIGTVVALSARSSTQATAVPSPWSARDIGSPRIAGSSSFDPATGSFAIAAAGKDISGTSDQFHFVYQPLVGDAVITARIDAVTFAHAWSRAGVMIRSSLNANAAHGFAFVSAGRGAGFQRRPSVGGTSLSTVNSAIAPPQWVRLVRTGSTVTASISSNGTAWTAVGSETIALGATAYVGIAVTSHNASQPTFADVSSVTAAATGALPPPQQNQDIGAPAIAGSANYSQGIYTVTAAGDDIWSSADQLHYVYQSVSGDVDVSVRVSSLTDVNPGAKAGVMIRESLAPGSANALAGLSAQNGYLFQRRAVTSGVTVNTVGGQGVAPGWVRLKRAGDLLTAYRSTDGTNWTVIGSDSFPMSAGVYVGIAVTSHNVSAATTAVLTGLNIQSLPVNQPPTASLTAPADGASYTAPATISLTASASDADGNVARVDFYNGSTLLGSDTTAPYSFDWSSVPAGAYALQATAVDDAGAMGSSAVATVTVNAGNQAPTVTLTAPSNGATFTAPASITLTATAFDADGTVARVDFYNGTALLGSDTAAPYAFTWGSVGAGNYALRAVAVDNLGAGATSATATITVAPAANQVPTATLTSPANGASFTAPATVALAASASDPDGTVARVDFYNGTTLLGTDATAPYTYTWGSVAAGAYALKAIAVDNAGASGSSATVTVTVSGAAGGLVRAFGLNEGTGSIVGDSSGNGAAGTINGATWASGRYGQALSFDGNDEVLLGDVDLPGAFTMMAWLQTRSLYGSGCGSAVMKALDYGVEICSGQLSANVGTGTGWSLRVRQTWTTADLNVWKHVALSYDGTTLRVYVDGVLVGSGPGAHATNNNQLILGRWTPASEYWNGLIDEVRLYSRALTAAEIQTDRNTPIAGGTPNQAPTATLTAPANGATFTAPASITTTATASDSDGTVARVDFYNGSTLLGSDTTAPYSFAWLSVGAGTYAVKATAVDNAGATGSSTVATITVTGNQAPTATLTAPANGATFTAPASVTLTATASDSDGTVARVDFYNGATLLGSDTTAPYSFAWSSVPVGTYALKATAVDNAGAMGSSAIATVTVNAGNQAPTVTLTAPPNGGTFTAPAGITLTASAADADGTVARVEFYSGAVLLATDTTAPYSFSWLNVLAGTYALRAIAYDNLGASATSATANITVSPNLTPPTGVVFQASTDHATAVTSYLLEIFAAGANPDTATPVASSDLGKPTPDANGDITVDRAAFFLALAPGSYVATVSALGSGGKGRSTPVTFTR